MWKLLAGIFLVFSHAQNLIFLWGYGRLSIVEDKVGLGELRRMLDVGEALEECRPPPLGFR